jgi:Probable lipoprotein LpqN
VNKSDTGVGGLQPRAVAPRDEDAKGPNPTIASYVQENNIQETPVKRGEPGSPTIDLPVPDGWAPAGEDTPEWAYGAIVYTGPDAGDYTPSIVALVSKLTGNVDPQQIIGAATDVIDSQTTITP